MPTQEKVDLFKEALGNYPTGVTVVTTNTQQGEPVGLTVNSFASVSIDPLMVLWSIDHGVSSLEEFQKADGFAVHILAGEQQELCKTFASKHEDRFSTCEWNNSENNLPVIKDAFAVLQCKTFKQVEAGDHTILIGEVQDIEVDSEKDPMLYHRRKFGPIPAEFYNE
ncbi:NADH-FMN oxidoreductase RutF, flavin reductase (DIM6/NTAB) family [Alteribacillus persepolensis]|uniref:NADH-FMN oxidoreductase RutF, flavin reductase (DIM6/NTAB) family n=1 Tax=Alteribacillus persepolensis TaxID=568899 RepID=A0A1G8B1T7_9BACI|nr:flavin reductase family protein [Alteribacillus persepolensis]SDH27094.1 NADH-FMN oxidoreductase RutF, flavin reductase (DIM6/NTAB) family [Alteribacillus persepolensis]